LTVSLEDGEFDLVSDGWFIYAEMLNFIEVFEADNLIVSLIKI